MLLLLYNIIIEGKRKTIWLESSYIPLQSGQTRFWGQQQQQLEPPRYVRRIWYNIIVIHLHCTITDINILYFIQSAMSVCALCIPIIMYILSRRGRNYFFYNFGRPKQYDCRPLSGGTLLSGRRARAVSAHASSYYYTRLRC